MPSSSKVSIFIPARLESTRFPRKMLYPIKEVPLIVRVLRQAQNLSIGECYVACDSEEIKDIIEENGGKAILTDPDLPSGTDRIYQALLQLKDQPEIIVNIQGDMAVFNKEVVIKPLKSLINNQDADMTTPVSLITQEQNTNNPNKVKIVFEGMQSETPGKALYFSRATIPGKISKHHPEIKYYEHIGIYVYRSQILQKIVKTPMSYLEKIEKLEQLRALENGIKIWAIPVKGKTVSIDALEDLPFAEKIIDSK